MVPVQRRAQIVEEAGAGRPAGGRLQIVDPDHGLVIAKLAVERIAGRARRRRRPGEHRLVQRRQVPGLAHREQRRIRLAERQADDGRLDEGGDRSGRQSLAVAREALGIGEAARLQRRLGRGEDQREVARQMPRRLVEQGGGLILVAGRGEQLGLGDQEGRGRRAGVEGPIERRQSRGQIASGHPQEIGRLGGERGEIRRPGRGLPIGGLRGRPDRRRRHGLAP